MNLANSIIVICFLFLVQPVTRFDTELNKMNQLKGEKFRERVVLMYDSLKNVSGYENRMQLADKLYELTSKKDEIAHIRSLVFRAAYSEKYPTALFDEAYKLAEKHDRINDINHVVHSRALYFMNKQEYDSAMVYILRFREKIDTNKEGEGYNEINNLLGDIYYHAGLYMKAQNIYMELLRVYEKAGNWNYFRPYVMMNNLGQISLKTDEIEEAKKWFNKSLEMAEKNLKTSYHYNTIAYTKIKLAETALFNNNTELAEQLLQEVANYGDENIFEDVKQEWIFHKARLLLTQGKASEAKELAEQLVPEGKHLYNEYRFVPEIYHLMADIYAELGLYPQAVINNKKFDKIKDSLRVREHLTSSMMVIAEYNEQLANQKLEQSEQRTGFVIKGSVVLIIVIIVILILYSRLYRSKLELVKKVLEDNSKAEIKILEPGNNAIDLSKEEDILQKKLISELKNWMETEKPYLEPGLSITEVATHLQTNRTYLSRAINSQLKTNFPNFINEHRIKESIKLILSGFTQEFTQEALANKSGFAGRNVFIAAFKKHTGVVPSFFIANYHKWDSQNKKFTKDPQDY